MSTDSALLQIVDAALAEAARKSGEWLVCRPGCSECCIGPFPISQLDARRLRVGLAELESHDPPRARRVRERARLYLARFGPEFPGGLAAGLLEGTCADEEPCPALDPQTGTCDLYAARPMTCRVFGPPMRVGQAPGPAVAVCELCFQGATSDEIAACEVAVDPDGLEFALLQELEHSTGAEGDTIVALVLA